ncbi:MULTISPECIES: hemerythrin domain-containing protein [Thermus]|uniref:Putative hemerythrin HHE cation binding domain subfamily n=1 Tax=Thermus scotoductus (strain ATCC 700910 / SA-01) TaxID=743525 RepID=E8PLW6_THESS|nr:MULTISPECIES: hemerythrin domain-containing protein [Thermus]ADW22385.1 putative hemerythrin HHE cation binding domain subfamily [Thermus scotoductus SA-01]ETN88600.1 hemerythrin [Thermus sp. NMX2.A1]
MIYPFEGKGLVRPGGQVRCLDLSRGRKQTLKVERSEDALLAVLKGVIVVRFWGRSLRLQPGRTVRVRTGQLHLEAPEGGRILWITLGLPPSELARDHKELEALLEALPSQGAAEALVQRLQAHIALEEALYYPTLSPGNRRDRLLEHRLLLELLGELQSSLREGRPVDGVVERLKIALQAHSEAELRT